MVQVRFDGACQPARGGGIATFGFTVEGEGLDHEGSGLAVPPWSPQATNNVAEYSAAICALEWLLGQGYAGPVLVLGDSELVIKQMNGDYEVRAEHLKAYHDRLAQLGAKFADVKFVWVPREDNRRADELSKIAIEEATPDARRLRRMARGPVSHDLAKPGEPG